MTQIQQLFNPIEGFEGTIDHAGTQTLKLHFKAKLLLTSQSPLRRLAHCGGGRRGLDIFFLGADSLLPLSGFG